ncbi:MAG: glycosyltransferase family 4 protein [Euryarchaeota archaeon]|nr:glycosyltransferase family 4 protein [Euryarchaeota archaeon]
MSSGLAVNFAYYEGPGGVVSRYARMFHEQLPEIANVVNHRIEHSRAIIAKYMDLRRLAKRRNEGDIWQFETQDLASLLNFTRFKNSVVTVHDLTLPFYPEYYPHELPVMIDSRLFVRGLKKADLVITISDFQRAEIARFTKIPLERIRTIHYGVPPGFGPVSEAERVTIRTKLGIGPEERIVLFVGSDQPRKNLPTLLRAMRQVVDAEKNARLVKVGHAERDLWRRQNEKAVADLGLGSKVTFAGHFGTNTAVAEWYHAADVFVFPTLYEGFGLPPLEAMACGLPVIASDACTMPEVVGDAGVLVPAMDEAAYARAIVEVLSDAGRSKELSRRGLERASTFSWEKAAREHVAAYQDLIEKR